MPQCLYPDQMTYFLNLTGLRFEMTENVLTLFATAGPVPWLWDGVAFCIGTGVGA